MAEILPNTSNDIGNRGCTNTTLTQFKGKPRQVLVNIEDAYRLVVMDGSTLGGKFKAASLDELNLVKNTANSALTKTLADGYYLAKTGKATTAGTADRANALTTARSIGITGAVTGAGVSFNGTANININTTAVDGTKVSTFTAATASTAGTVGAVPAPSAGAQAKFLRGDGTWQVPTNTDTKVVQTQSTTAGEYALLAKDNTGVTTTTSGSVFSDGVTVNPNTKTITATTFKGSLHGNATSATKATNATKASQDAAGNDIPTTYATKAEVTAGLAGKEDKGTCLPLTGGTLTGPIFITEDNHISAVAPENFKGLEIGGGRAWKDGAGLFLRSNSATGESESGRWGLVAQNAASGTEGILIGQADNLWFNGGLVERSNEIFGATIEEGFYDVYRYATGLQIIIVGVTIPANQLSLTFTFPRPFINQSYSIAANAYTENGDVAVTWALDTTTSIKLFRKYYSGNFNLPTYIKCAFIGKWK